MCVYYVKSVNMSRSLLFQFRCLYICVCTMLIGLICQGVHCFMCLYIICVCTLLSGLICQGIYHFRSLYICVYYVKRVYVKESIMSRVYIYMCVYYVKSVNMSRSLLFHEFVYVCTMLKGLICQGVCYFMCL